MKPSSTKPRRSRLDLVASLSLSVVSVSLVLGIAEYWVRPQPTYSFFLKTIAERYRDGGFIPFTLLPNYTSRTIIQDKKDEFGRITINSLGLRGPETTLEKPLGKKRVLILGDSFTFGTYVDQEEVYARVLERLLHASGYEEAEVINAGYADGFDPDQHYAWLVNQGLKFSPDLIIYGFFVGNDLEYLEHSNWQDLDEHGLPRKVVNPNLWIDDEGRLRSRSVDSRTVGVETIYRIPLLRDSHLAIWAARRRWPEKEEVHFVDADYIPYKFVLLPKSDAKMLQQEEMWYRLVDGFRKVAEANHAKFLILNIPASYQLDPTGKSLALNTLSNKFRVRRNFFAEAKPKLDRMGIQYVDLFALMKAKPGFYYPKNGEVHFNANGHAFAAEALKRAIVRHHLLGSHQIAGKSD